MKAVIALLFFIVCVFSYHNRHKLPYGGAILKRNGELIPGNNYHFHLKLFAKTEVFVPFSGAISCIWTKIFDDMERNFADSCGSLVFQNMKKYLNGIDIALSNDNTDELLPLLKKYQAYLKESLLYIHDPEIQDALYEIIDGNVKLEQECTQNGLDMNAMNVYVKHSAVRLNEIMIANKRY